MSDNYVRADQFQSEYDFMLCASTFSSIPLVSLRHPTSPNRHSSPILTTISLEIGHTLLVSPRVESRSSIARPVYDWANPHSKSSDFSVLMGGKEIANVRPDREFSIYMHTER
jgi:hypothetical protein